MLLCNVYVKLNIAPQRNLNKNSMWFRRLAGGELRLSNNLRIIKYISNSTEKVEICHLIDLQLTCNSVSV